MLIGEVSQRSGISTRMLRHYDRIGLVTPTGRTQGGYRQYSDADVQRLFHVEALRSLGLGLQEVEEALGDLAFDPAPMVEQLIDRTRENLAREEELLRRLEQVHTSRPAAWADVLRTIGLIRGLRSNDPSARLRLALTLTGDEDDVGSVAEAALGESDPNVAGTLYWALARYGDGAIPPLADALDSPDAERRRRAVTALEKLDSSRARAVLAAAVAHPDAFVSGRAALVRGALGELDAVPTLVALVVEGRDDVRAAETLGALATDDGDPDATVDPATVIVRGITDALASAPPEARRRLTAALAEIPGAAADAALASLRDDADRGVALTASALLRGRS